MNSGELSIAEIPFKSGSLQYRFARYLADDGERWIRHGLFQAYHENGNLASEGSYHHGVETGHWRDFHQDGRLAAVGTYIEGKEADDWKYSD